MGVPERGSGSGKRVGRERESARQHARCRLLTVIPAVHLEEIDVVRLQAREAGVYAERGFEGL